MHHIWLPLVPPPPTSYSNFETTRGYLLPGYEWPLKPHQCVQEIASSLSRLTTAPASSTPHFLPKHNMPPVIFYSRHVYILLNVLLAVPVLEILPYKQSRPWICMNQLHYRIQINGITNDINRHNGCRALRLCQPPTSCTKANLAIPYHHYRS